MGANKLEKMNKPKTKNVILEAFETVKINRRDIHNADYNPRGISESARKKLRAKLKKWGRVQPEVVNKRTMNIVGGHQRIKLMDDAERRDDYEFTVAMIDVDEKEEVAINMFLNNASAQGEWDIMLLQDIKGLFPDIDYEQDMGFDESDINILFGKREAEEKLIEEQAIAEEFTPDTFREAKKKSRQKAKADNETGGDVQPCRIRLCDPDSFPQQP
jgi:hypothetical protein